MTVTKKHTTALNVVDIGDGVFAEQMNYGASTSGLRSVTDIISRHFEDYNAKFIPNRIYGVTTVAQASANSRTFGLNTTTGYATVNGRWVKISANESVTVANSDGAHIIYLTVTNVSSSEEERNPFNDSVSLTSATLATYNAITNVKNVTLPLARVYVSNSGASVVYEDIYPETAFISLDMIKPSSGDTLHFYGGNIFASSSDETGTYAEVARLNQDKLLILDDKKITFGTDSDTSIYYSGSSAYWELPSGGLTTSIGNITVITPTSDYHAATKKYVDDTVATENELSEMNDITFTSLANGDLLQYSGSGWINSTSFPGQYAFTNSSGTTLDITNHAGFEIDFTGTTTTNIRSKQDMHLLAQAGYGINLGSNNTAGILIVASDGDVDIANNLNVSGDLGVIGNIVNAGWTGDVIDSAYLDSNWSNRNLTLTSTDGGASASPIFKLHRNSSSPADNDFLGKIQFTGEDYNSAERTYAWIEAQIVDEGILEDGALYLAAAEGGSIDWNGIKIYGNGTNAGIQIYDGGGNETYHLSNALGFTENFEVECQYMRHISTDLNENGKEDYWYTSANVVNNDQDIWSQFHAPRYRDGKPLHIKSVKIRVIAAETDAYIDAVYLYGTNSVGTQVLLDSDTTNRTTSGDYETDSISYDLGTSYQNYKIMIRVDKTSSNLSICSFMKPRVLLTYET